jgi:hypothetical protein
MTSNGSGVYSITANNSANWNTAYGWGDHGLSAQDKTDIGNLSGTNTGDQDLSSYATQSYVGTQISNLVDSSPATLNTLNELAAALGDDPNFATTTANSIGLKAPLASPSFTGIITANSSSSGDYVRLYGSSGTGKWDIYGNGANLRISDNESAGILAVDTGATFGGNVGIGVAAHGTASLNITNTNQHIRLNNGSELGIISLDTDGKLDLWAHGTDETINFRTGTGSGTVTMSVVGGKVGIGTATPQKKVHIEGTGGASEMQILVSSASDTVGHTAGIGLRGEGGEADGDLRIKGGIFFERIAGSFGNGKMILAVNSSVSNTSVTVADHALTIDTNKNVGIGTTSPLSPLTVHGQQRWYTTNSDGNELRGFFNPGGSGDPAELSLYQANGTSVGVELRATGNSYFSGGNVGIGETTPVTKLHVKHPAAINDAYGLVLIENTNTGSSGPTNSAVNVKNKFGTSQFMQWENKGVRIGSRVLANGGTGDIIFTAGSDQEKMRLRAGGGITFNGDTASANALDDYEEGTWTPVIQHNNGTGNVPIASATARYVKVGDLVYISAWIDGFNTGGGGHAGSGAYYGIRGMPFVPENYGAWQIVYASSGVTSYGGYSSSVSLYFMHNGTNGQRSANHVNGAGVNAWGAGQYFMMNCTYRVQ